MPGIPNFQFERVSFWIGFLAATVFWWVARKLWDLWPGIYAAYAQRAETARKQNQAGIGERLRRETFRRVQSMHLANSLFALDEILIEPRLIAPPVSLGADGSLALAEFGPIVIPNTPDWPEISADFSVPTLSLAEALQGGSNIAVVGQPGCGKSVALASLVAQIARHDPAAGSVASFLPVLIHAGDLAYPFDTGKDPFNTITIISIDNAPIMVQPQVPGYLRAAARTGELLLVFDGVDEFSQAVLQDFTAFLKRLLVQFPRLRFILSASTEHLDGLTAMGVVPLALKAWNRREKAQFMQRWSDLWMQHVEGLFNRRTGTVDPSILNSWLALDGVNSSPLELTLRIWAGYAGDSQGIRNVDAVEAYLRRAIPEPKMRPAIERLALQMVLAGQATIQRSQANALVSEYEKAVLPAGDAQDEIAALRPGPKLKPERKSDAHTGPVSRTIPDLLDSGLFTAHQENRLAFTHPVLLGYLAAYAISESTRISDLLAQPAWIGKSMTMRYLGSISDITNLVDATLSKTTDDPLHRGLLGVARWLDETPTNTRWRGQVMRKLVELLQNETEPLNVRARALGAFLISNDTSTVLLMRQLLNAPARVVRQLAVLGVGALGDVKSVPDLIKALNDPEHEVQLAACLSLVSIATPTALEAARSILSQGDEILSRACAEALAVHAGECRPILEQAAGSENLLVRRAAVFGLQQANQPWSTALLQKMSIEDGQWVVRNAAVQAMEDIAKPHHHIPHPLLAPHNAPWLVAFASKLGMGVAPDQPAVEILLQAVKSGTVEEKLAAFAYLAQTPEPSRRLVETVTDALSSGDPHIVEAACAALWTLSLASPHLPGPQRVA